MPDKYRKAWTKVFLEPEKFIGTAGTQTFTASMRKWERKVGGAGFGLSTQACKSTSQCCFVYLTVCKIYQQYMG